MKRVPQTIIETFAALALEFDRTAAQDSRTARQEQEMPGSTHITYPTAMYHAGWSGGKTSALESALRALAPDDWNNTVTRWCETYERLERESAGA